AMAGKMATSATGWKPVPRRIVEKCVHSLLHAERCTVGSAGCQPAPPGSLPGGKNARRNSLATRIAKTRCGMFAASCRELQAGSLRSPREDAVWRLHIHSDLRATIGLTRQARRAGSQAARTVTMERMRPT